MEIVVTMVGLLLAVGLIALFANVGSSYLAVGRRVLKGQDRDQDSLLRDDHKRG